jgi:ABC-type amino acid transport substrate-binding protein
MKMKKIITVLLAFSMMFCLGGCDNPFQKTKEAEDTQKPKEITSIKTKGSMEGITLRVGVSPDMAPFTVKNKNTKEVEGFDIDLLEALSEYLGFDYVLVVEQMKGIEKDLEDKKIDCAISGISITDSRLEKFKFTDSYFENSMTLIANKDVKAESKKDIVHMKLATEEGTSEHEYLNKYLKKYNNKIITYKNMSRVYRDLEKGKVDAAIYDSTGVDYYLKNHPESNIVIVEKKLYSEQSDYGIMCTRDFKYIDELNVGMKQLDLGGTYQEIYNKWFNETEEK